MVHNGHKGHTNGYLLRFLMMKKGTQWGHNRGTKGTQSGTKDTQPGTKGHNRAQRDTTGHKGTQSNRAQRVHNRAQRVHNRTGHKGYTIEPGTKGYLCHSTILSFLTIMFHLHCVML